MFTKILLLYYYKIQLATRKTSSLLRIFYYHCRNHNNLRFLLRSVVHNDWIMTVEQINSAWNQFPRSQLPITKLILKIPSMKRKWCLMEMLLCYHSCLTCIVKLTILETHAGAWSDILVLISSSALKETHFNVFNI